ncbi:MAG: two-component sensor histidine kinase [Treponema sp.]|nr:two-component sensor histidine kinase [Treponema sp.]
MKRKINSRFLILSTASIIVTTILLTFVFYDILKKQVFENLKNTAEIISSFLSSNGSESTPEVFLSSDNNLRITIIKTDGSVIYDSASSSEFLENHLNRPEVNQVLKTGTGKIIRKSDTLSESLFYYALLLKNGTILRVGKKSSNVFAIIFSVLPAVAITLIFLFALSILFSHFLTKAIIKPINRMADNLDEVDINPVYPELLPIARKIRSQHDTILSTVNMRQEFTANVSHELKTPLTAISGYAELLENGMADSDKKQTEYFAGEIHKNADRLLSLINDILRLSELDSSPKQDSVVGENSDLAKIVEETIDMLKLEAKKNGIKMKYSGPKSLVLPVSKELLQELCYNLVQNAVRYNKPDGKVKIKAEKQLNSISFSVEDTGIGIPLEAQDRVFERFYRVDKSRSKELGGTGLGLSIVKHIAEITGGKISLESKLGLGTKISVTFENY